MNNSEGNIPTSNSVVAPSLISGTPGGKTIIGGTGAGENLTFQSTSDSTKGIFDFDSTIKVNNGYIYLDKSLFATSKFNSQGATWASFGNFPSFIFNSDAAVRPEISWIRGSRTYPEFTIRQNATADTGGEIYVGNGTSVPLKLFGFRYNSASPLAVLTQVGANATGTADQRSSTSLVFEGSGWNGSTATTDQWTIRNSMSTSADRSSTLSFAYNGTNAMQIISDNNANTIDSLTLLQEMRITASQSSSTVFAGYNAGVMIQNTNNTANNLSMFSSRNQGGLMNGALVFRHTNHNGTTGSGDIEFWNSNGAAADKKWSILASGSLQSPSTNTGGISIFNTADETTNYEKLTIDVSSNVFRILSSQGGTGTLRSLQLGSSGRSQLRLNNSSPYTQIVSGASVAATSLDVVFTPSNSTGTAIFQSITGTITQSSTAAYTALLINPTESSVGSGAKRLISAQVGGVDKFVVNNEGVVFPISAPTASAPTYVKGGIYFDTTLNKLRVGGATAWETITSA